MSWNGYMHGDMKLKWAGLFVIALLIAVGLGMWACPACTATKARPAALFPPAQLAWPAVAEDLARGIADGVEDEDIQQPAADALTLQSTVLGEALETKNQDKLRTVNWEELRPWASRGIDDKLDDHEIGPGVANSLREQLKNFTSTILQLQR
jgi:hypothetical protein